MRRTLGLPPSSQHKVVARSLATRHPSPSFLCLLLSPLSPSLFMSSSSSCTVARSLSRSRIVLSRFVHSSRPFIPRLSASAFASSLPPRPTTDGLWTSFLHSHTVCTGPKIGQGFHFEPSIHRQMTMAGSNGAKIMVQSGKMLWF